MINDNNTELSMFKNGELEWAGMPTGTITTGCIPQLKDKGKLHSSKCRNILGTSLTLKKNH